MGSQEQVRVTFVPGEVSVEVDSGSTVLAAASRAGLVIPAPCGGRGACGRCAISVEAGELKPPSAEEVRALVRARTEPSKVRLACMAKVSGPVTVHARVLSSSHVDGGFRRTAARRRVVGAVDLGTTTVSAAVLDPSSGERLGKATVGNRQTIHGADILSRISAALEGRGPEMREAAEASLIEAVELSCEDAGIAATGFERIVVAANTAMLSLLVGVDVSGLAVHPFAHAIPDTVPLGNPAFAQAFPGARLLAIPPVEAFVGGDLTAGLIAEGLAEGATGVAYLDIGTNAEIAVLQAGDVHLASAPAGPAFEGWGIACGGLADMFGIVRMKTGGDGGWQPITPGGPATHLTGSGLVSAVAVLRRLGHLDSDGRLAQDGPLAESFFVLPDGVRAVSLGDVPGERGVYLSQLDIRAFQYAKAAVCVALQSCCVAAEITGTDLHEYVVAGSFGGALAERDLLDVGVVPREASGRLRYAGEAALNGALAVALEPDLLETARRFSVGARHVDLAADESFSERFIAQTRLEAYSL